jgi:AcrR family transcriptional regulator
VLAATIGELSDHAYDEISIEKIAARAGVHKTTIYRRWGSKAELITHALTTVAESMMKIPDTGSIESDLRTFCRSVRVTISSPRGAATVRALLAGAAASAEIRGVMQQFWAARQSAIAVIVERAVTRGELPAGTDPAPVMHAMAAPLYYRLLVTGEALTEQDGDRAAAAALAAARAGVFRRAELDPASPPR